MLVADLLEALDRRFDLSRAAAWDRVGLQVGSPHQPVGQVGVCHEVTQEAIDEIVAANVATLVAYHPLLFAPTTSFIEGPTAEGRALKLAVAGVSLIVVHTAFDVAAGGTADSLASELGVKDVTGFGCKDDDPDRCIGRIGRIAPTELGRLADLVAERLNAPVRVAGGGADRIQAVAVVPGSGGSFVGAAAHIADVLVTGDLKHHDVAQALDNGLAIIDAGHIPSERPGINALYAAVCAMTDDVVRIGTDPDPWKD